ncbi:hypothetical protein [Roseovarius sp. EL26]|uniref:hypothetical protein n=1 Tax=Roseovarius sp. EL26 TaxID=2126672 RepID=UPI000EA1AC65|nr:hypothetical protein [Roseovarius sp. EL26]
MPQKFTERPLRVPSTYMNFPFEGDLDRLNADIAVLGVPFGMPYAPYAMANEESSAPDALHLAFSEEDSSYFINHYDFDLGGPFLDNRDIKIVDC